MFISKDETLILADAINEHKFSLNDKVRDYANSRNIKSFNAFEDLQYRLEQHSHDKRRDGRTSQNSFTDVLRRFITNYTLKHDTTDIHR